MEEHEHVRDTTPPPKHYGCIYVTRSMYEVTFPMSFRNVGSSCPHYRERRRSPHRTDSDALYAVGGGNTGPPAFELFSLNLLATPVTFSQQKGSYFGNSRVADVLHFKKLSNNFKSSITRCSCDKYGVNMYKLRRRAAADVQQQNVTASNSKTPEILLALAQYAPEYLRCWEACVFSVPIHSSLY